MCPKIQDSRKLIDDNKKRKRKPRVVVICSCNERKQALNAIEILIFKKIKVRSNIKVDNMYYKKILVSRNDPNLVRKITLKLILFLRLLLILTLPYNKFIYSSQREIKNGGQVPAHFIVGCPELKATC